MPDTALNRAILRNFHAERSGDIFVVFEPNVFINDFDGLTVTSTHGSPWRYDTHVPVIFAGADLEARRVSARLLAEFGVGPRRDELETVTGTGIPSASRRMDYVTNRGVRLPA